MRRGLEEGGELRGGGLGNQEGKVEVVEEGEEKGWVLRFQLDQVREVVLERCAMG